MDNQKKIYTVNPDDLDDLLEKIIENSEESEEFMAYFCKVFYMQSLHYLEALQKTKDLINKKVLNLPEKEIIFFNELIKNLLELSGGVVGSFTSGLYEVLNNSDCINEEENIKKEKIKVVNNQNIEETKEENDEIFKLLNPKNFD